jgi:hypothetical protein
MLNLILTNKPVLVGLHLAVAIIGVDALLWVAGELIANPINRKRMRIAAWTGIIGLALSWIVGGYYYLNYYGSLVKPGILKGSAPWAHTVAMEAKEHIFLFMVPMACVVLCSVMMDREQFNQLKLKQPILILTLTTAVTALSLGLMGYIISAAARWGIA